MSWRIAVLCALLALLACDRQTERRGLPDAPPMGSASAEAAVDFEGDFEVDVLDCAVVLDLVHTDPGAAPVPVSLHAGTSFVLLAGYETRLLVQIPEDTRPVPVAVDGPIALGAENGHWGVATPEQVQLFRLAEPVRQLDLGNELTAAAPRDRPRTLTWTEDTVLVPWHETPNGMATLLSWDGAPLGSAAVAADWEDGQTAAHWRYGDGIYYAALLDAPRIALFDPGLELITSFVIDSPAVYAHQLRQERLGARARRDAFFDAFVVEGRTGYLLAEGWLHQVDLHSARVTRLARLRAPAHPVLGNHPRLRFSALARDADGSLLLGGGPSRNGVFRVPAQ